MIVTINLVQQKLEIFSKKLFLSGIFITAILLPLDRLTKGLNPVEIISLILLLQRPLIYFLLHDKNVVLKNWLKTLIWFLLPAAVLILTSLLALHPSLSWGFSLVIFGLLIRSWLVTEFTDKTALALFEKTVLIITAIVVIFGYYQFFADLLGYSEPVTLLAQSYSSRGTFNFPRVHSTALEPLYLAHFLFLPLGIMAYRFIKSPLRKNKHIVALFIPTLALLILTNSRGAIGGFIFTTLLLVISRNIPFLKRFSIVTISAIMVALFLIVSAPFLPKPGTILPPDSKTSFTERVLSFDDPSALERYAQWSKAIEAVRNDPLTGIGPANARAYLNPRLYGQGMEYDRLLPINNDFFTLLAEQGILGIVGFIGLFVLIIRIYIFTFSKGFNTPTAPYAFALAGMAVQSNTFGSLALLRTWIVIGMLFATFRLATNKLATQ